MRYRLLALTVAVVLSGCGTEAIVVSEAAITDSPDAQVLGWTANDAPRLVFSPEDEEVTIHALFEFNYRGVYEWYKVEWIAPDGSPYKVVSLRTDFGSHRDIKASLKIRGKMASRLPGVWRARLWLLGREGAPPRLLVSRLFRIDEPTPAMVAAGLTPVDAPAEGAPRPLARVSAGAAAAPAPGTQAPPAPRTDPTTVAAGQPGSAAPGTGSPPDASPDADFGLLPPLAVMLPEQPKTTATGAPDAGKAVPAPAGAGDPARGTPEVVPETPSVAGTPKSEVPRGAGAEVVSVSLTSTPATGPLLAPSPASRRYPGCPPMYYPPGPGCVEEAPEE